MYLPIAAEAEAASGAAAELPAGPEHARAGARHATPDNVPAQIEPSHDIEPHTERGTPLIPSIPDATRAAARWVRPLVPPFVARVIDNTTAPLHTARQVFEDVEEIAFSFKRTRKITVDTERSDITEQPPAAPAPAEAPAAAVADWRVDDVRDQKLKKGTSGAPRLSLVENPDILGEVAKAGEARPRLVVGFAAETENVVQNAQRKQLSSCF